MIKKLFYLFVFFAPFTSFFALSAWLRLPVVINQLLFLTLIIAAFKNNKVKTKWLLKEDLYLFAFLGIVLLSFLFGYREQRSFNHSLAYINSVLFYFFLFKYVVVLLKITSKEIAKIIYWSFCTISFIIITDFIGRNFYNYSLRSVFSEVDGAISNMDYFIRSGYRRVGGVAEEPGHMALFYNIYFGITLYYIHLKKNFKKYFFVCFLFIVSHFAMLSNAGIVLPIIALALIFIINKLKTLRISENQVLMLLSLLVLLFISVTVILFFDVGNTRSFLEEFFNKIFFNESAANSSSGQRLLQWKRALFNFIERPVLGKGPGFGVHEDAEGYLSVYLTILADVGIISFLLFVSFQQVIVKKVMQLEKYSRGFLLLSIITSFLHIIIVADFYHAPLWILLAFVQLVYKEQNQVKL